MTNMTKTSFGKIGVGVLCVTALWSLAGCGSKSDSGGKPTAAEIAAFNGHKPTDAQLKAAIAKATQNPATAPPSAPVQPAAGQPTAP